jgi:hypothetical protein
MPYFCGVSEYSFTLSSWFRAPLEVRLFSFSGSWRKSRLHASNSRFRRCDTPVAALAAVFILASAHPDILHRVAGAIGGDLSPKGPSADNGHAKGRYNVARLMEKYGDAKLPDLRHTPANCPRRTTTTSMTGAGCVTPKTAAFEQASCRLERRGNELVHGPDPVHAMRRAASWASCAVA